MNLVSRGFFRPLIHVANSACIVVLFSVINFEWMPKQRRIPEATATLLLIFA